MFLLHILKKKMLENKWIKGCIPFSLGLFIIYRSDAGNNILHAMPKLIKLRI